MSRADRFRNRLPAIAVLLLAAVLCATLPASAQRGIAGRPAPSWDGLTWLNLPEGVETLDLSDFRGKTLYIFCFQSWCPGCHSHGFPALKAVEEHLRDRDDVFFIAVQTVFEGFGTNTAERGLAELESYGLEIPLAHDEGDGGPGPFMRRYRTGGTPWTILVDPEGVVRFNGFRVDPAEAVRWIDQWRPRSAGDEEDPRGGA